MGKADVRAVKRAAEGFVRWAAAIALATTLAPPAAAYAMPETNEAPASVLAEQDGGTPASDQGEAPAADDAESPGPACGACSSEGDCGTCLPSEEDWRRYAEDGTLEERIAFQQALGNDVPSDRLVQQAQAREADCDATLREVPEAWQGGMATTGEARGIMLRVDFPDMAFAEDDTYEALDALLGGPDEPGDAASFPYESLYAYYQRSSYGKLSLTADTFNYTAQHDRAYYTGNIDGLFEEALLALEASGALPDFSQYDANDDGKLDAVYLHFAGGDTGWGSVWWSNERESESTVSFGGKTLCNVVTLHLSAASEGAANTLIHETGHVLGLPDYYNYASFAGQAVTAPSGLSGIQTFDMMMGNFGDHNGFSKWMLGWIDDEDVVRIVANDEGTTVKKGSQTVLAMPSGTPVEQALGSFVADDEEATGGIIVVSNDDGGLFSSYYLLQYDQFAGNQSVHWRRSSDLQSEELPSGFRLFRVQAGLDDAGWNFKSTNANGTVFNQLIELVDADIQQIHAETAMVAPSAGDSYGCMLQPGNPVTPTSTPSTNFYENGNVGFTGLTIEALPGGTDEGGTVRISYDASDKPESGAFDLAYQSGAACDAATIELTASSAPVAAANFSLLHPSIVVDGASYYASVQLDGTTVEVSYSLETGTVKPGSACSIVFPAGMFAVGVDDDGEAVLSEELAVAVPTGAVVAYEATGIVGATGYDAGPAAESNVVEILGRDTMFELVAGTLRMVAFDGVETVETAAATELALADGVSVTASDAAMRAIPLDEGKALVLAGGTMVDAYLVDCAEGLVTDKETLELSLDTAGSTSDGALLSGWAHGSSFAVLADVTAEGDRLSVTLGAFDGASATVVDGKEVVLAAPASSGGLEARSFEVDDLAGLIRSDGSRTLAEAVERGDLLRGWSGAPCRAFELSDAAYVADAVSYGTGLCVLGVRYDEGAGGSLCVLNFVDGDSVVRRQEAASTVSSFGFARMVAGPYGSLALVQTTSALAGSGIPYETQVFAPGMDEPYVIMTSFQPQARWVEGRLFLSGLSAFERAGTIGAGSPGQGAFEQARAAAESLPLTTLDAGQNFSGVHYVLTETIDYAGYADVTSEDWFSEDVRYVTERGIMSGYGNGLFGPGDGMARQDMACLLFKWLAPDEASAYESADAYCQVANETDCTDVADGAYYTPAANWAAREGLLLGYGDEFGVGSAITREELATVLHRMAGSPAATTDLGEFVDGDAASPWSHEAVAWCVEQGVLEGFDGALRPGDRVMRCEAAAMVARYDRGNR